MSEPEAHLLVVDDDERIRTLLRRYLMRHGHLVTWRATRPTPAGCSRASTSTSWWWT